MQAASYDLCLNISNLKSACSDECTSEGPYLWEFNNKTREEVGETKQVIGEV